MRRSRSGNDDGWKAWIEEVVMILAPASMWGSASCTLQKSEKTLVAKVYSSCSVERCAISLTACCVPALSTRVSSPSSARTASRTMRRQLCSSLRSPGSSVRRLPFAVEQRAERSGIGLFGRQIVDGDVGPFAGESDGDGAADSRVAARDERLAPQQPPVSAIALFAGVGTGLHPAFESRRLLLLGGVGVVVVLPARVDEDIVAIVRHDVKRCGGRRCPAFWVMQFAGRSCVPARVPETTGGLSATPSCGK